MNFEDKIHRMSFEKGLRILDLDNTKFNLVVTSPPYFNARDYGGEKLFEDEDAWLIWCCLSVLSLSKRLKPGGVIWWNTGSGYKDHKKMTVVYKMVVFLEKRGVHLIDEIPWVKKSSPPKKIRNRPYAGWEHNFIFSPNPEKATYYPDHVRRPYAEATKSRMKYKLGKLTPDQAGEYGEQTKTVTPNPKGAMPPNYLILPQDTSKRPHPAPMLPQLASWAIRAYSKEGDLVLDPMAGVGTTWVECRKLKRRFIGFELFEEYIKKAELSIARLERGDDPYNGLKKEWESLQNE